eukprot:TRINITY_DN6029_c0_g1_i3.p1 TRINITY_DN6029_c0_g1~~TRINITY_DN6029_c0_g1_i3.p1  ORF type:complete len:685 (-),score=46.66 TRINITY_DN6029_c0_g1_i3:662-2689(-)
MNEKMSQHLHDPILADLIQPVCGTNIEEHFLKIPSNKYIDKHELRLLTGTFNVHGSKPGLKHRLSDWLSFPDRNWPEREGNKTNGEAGAGVRVGEENGDGGQLSQGPDIVILGFQEIVSLSASNVLVGGNLEGIVTWDQFIDAHLNKQPWKGMKIDKDQDVLSIMEGMWSGGVKNAYSKYKEQEALLAYQPRHANSEQDLPSSTNGARRLSQLEESREYIQLVGKYLVGLYLTVWVRRKLVPHVRGLQTLSLGTGAMGLGNKGAVAVRFRVYDSSFLVCCCHLPSGASESELIRRNWALAEIQKRCSFQNVWDSSKYNQLTPMEIYRSIGVSQINKAGEQNGQWKGVARFEDHEHVILLGDLNYRVNTKDDVAIKLIRSNQLNQLMLYDQLVNEMERETVLQGWKEGILNFPPTYKFVKGTSLYHGEKSKFKPGDKADDTKSARTPSWTDRIIFRSTGGLHQLSYSSGNFQLSDHKPVYAAFLVYARQYNPTKVSTALELAIKASDAQENASIPEVHVKQQNIDLQQVVYGIPRQFKIGILNKGQVPAVFRFIAPPYSDSICPPWLRVWPHSTLNTLSKPKPQFAETFILKYKPKIQISPQIKIAKRKEVTKIIRYIRIQDLPRKTTTNESNMPSIIRRQSRYTKNINSLWRKLSRCSTDFTKTWTWFPVNGGKN